MYLAGLREHLKGAVKCFYKVHYRTGDTLCFCLPRSPAAPGSLCKACSPLIFISMAATLISLNYDHQRATRAGREDLLRPCVSSFLAKHPILGHRTEHLLDLPRAPRKVTGLKTTFFSLVTGGGGPVKQQSVSITAHVPWQTLARGQAP